MTDASLVWRYFLNELQRDIFATCEQTKKKKKKTDGKMNAYIIVVMLLFTLA